jgi:hypothetical protein
MNELELVTRPYIIAHPEGADYIYDYGVCGVLENYIYDGMDKGKFSASFNYCDFACDGVCVQGCMTITLFRTDFIPEVHTFLYERELNNTYEL